MKTNNQKSSVLIVLCLLAMIMIMPLNLAYAADSQLLNGAGSPEDPYQITNADQLAAINNDLTAHYLLMNDIDLNNQEWTPLTIFDGSLDGDGFTIKGLSITSNQNFQGLFGELGSNGKLYNFTVEGSISGNNSVGAVVGYNNGLIEAVVNRATVTAAINGGGIVGYNLGTIKDSYNAGTVIGTSSNTGGVAGRNNSLIYDVYNDGLVKGSTSTGGVIGHNVGHLLNAYNIADIESDHYYVGGLVGQNDTGNASICNVYNSGTISSTSNYAPIGGVVGYHYNGKLINVYNRGNLSGTGFDAKIGGITGYVGISAYVEGAYWLESSALSGISQGNGYNNRINVLSFDSSGLLAEAIANDSTLLDVLNSGAAIYNATSPVIEAKVWIEQDDYPVFEGSVPEQPEITITGLTIKQEPIKKTYFILETIDLSGLEIVANLSDGSEKTIAHSDLSLSGFNSTQAELEQVITIKYGNHSAEFMVDILMPEPPKYRVQINLDGGNGQPSGDGEYAADETVTIIAGTKSGFTFSGWQVSGDIVQLQDASKSTTEFTMPASEVTIMATWTAISGGVSGGGGGGGGGGSGSGGGGSSDADNEENTEADDLATAINPEDTVQITDSDIALSEIPWPFIDVLTSDWFYEAVKYVFEQGLMQGVSDNEFAPQLAMNRAMMWTILARLEQVQTEGGDEWYSLARQWAMDSGVSDGHNPLDYLTREQLVTMLYRYSGNPLPTEGELNFSDADAISPWALDAMTWAVQVGIITGLTETTIEPQGTATRAQLATILMRFLTIE